MKSITITILLSLVLIGSFLPLRAKGESPVTVIEGGTLIDGTSGTILDEAVIVIRGDRIAAIGKKGSVSIPKDARMISAKGQFILPGLIDGHVHYHEWQGELHLAHGVTTVKDTGNPVEWLKALSRAIADGRVKGPRLFYTGNSLTAPPALRDHHIGLESPEMGRQAVRLLKQHGAVAIKVHQQITPDLLQAVTDEAHKLGLPVTAHLRHIGAKEAALAGIDGLEHATGIARSTGPNPDLRKGEQEDELRGYYDDLNEAAEMREENFASLVKLLVEKDVAIQPTLITFFRITSDHRANYAREDAEYAKNENLRYVPKGIKQIWQTSSLFEPRSADDLKRFRTAYSKMSRFLKLFHEAGGKVLVGSSTSIMVPGLSLHREMEMMAELGFTPRQVIEMTTRGNAEFLRRDRELGTLAVGKLADMIIVEANPLADLKNLRRLALVMKGGKVVDTTYHPDYAMPIPRPKVEQPVWLEVQLKKAMAKESFSK